METDVIKLDIISPEGHIVTEMVSKVELPGSAGRFVVLRNHAPLLSSLVKGEIVYETGDGVKTVALSSGFVEVNDNEVNVCVEL